MYSEQRSFVKQADTPSTELRAGSRGTAPARTTCGSVRT
jgi:hypothetical protein